MLIGWGFGSANHNLQNIWADFRLEKYAVLWLACTYLHACTPRPLRGVWAITWGEKMTCNFFSHESWKKSAETCKWCLFENSEEEAEKCVSKVLCKWFIKALIELLPLITFFWFWLANVLVLVVVLLEVKFWKRQSPVRRMMLSIKRESAKLFQQNKVSSYKL